MLRKDAAKQHESDVGRIRALYRIPGVPGTRRTLEVCTSLASAVLGENWPASERATLVLVGPGEDSAELQANDASGSVVKRARLGDPLPFAADSFDLIVLHGTLDELGELARRGKARFDADALMQRLVGLLAPGGLIAGCVGNRTDPRRMFGHLFTGRGVPQANSLPARFTIRSCTAMLRRAGLTDARLHNVLPHADSPMKVVEVQRHVTRVAFSRELEGRVPRLGFLGYLVRRLVLELGLYPWMEQSIFFWGYRPC